MNPSELNVDETPARPWWRFGMVWMVVGGPLIVVFASFITLYLAVTRPDPVTDRDYYEHGLSISHAPAEQARNHAQTGVPRAPVAP